MHVLRRYGCEHDEQPRLRLRQKAARQSGILRLGFALVAAVMTFALPGLGAAKAAMLEETSEPVVSPALLASQGSEPAFNSPCALAVSPHGRTLYVGCATTHKVAEFDTVLNKAGRRISVPGSPASLTLSRDGSRLYAACSAPSSTICVIDTTRFRILREIGAGHTATAVVLSPDEQRLYVCNRFDNDVSVIDLLRRKELKRIAVEREPVAAALTPDGAYLLVANHLHAQAANQPYVSATVSVINTSNLVVRKHILLPLGASFLNGIAVSPNGLLAAIPHVHSTYWLSTSGVEFGRMNSSALTVLDLEKLEVLGMIFLDQTLSGAANPWGVVWSPDGNTIAVTHAGAHAVSLVDAPLDADRASFSSARIGAYEPTESGIAPLPKHRPVRLRMRVAVPGNGPRALAQSGSQVYVANYFSENLCRIDLSRPDIRAEPLTRARSDYSSVERRGEMLFNDAQLCFQGWQSCASCHDTDGRSDALNWDLLNDGISNPKNTRTLLYAHQTGRTMSLGVRANAADAVRAGIHHILFADQPEDVAKAIDVYLQSLRPVPSPHLRNSRLSSAAARGKRIFMSAQTGCVNCHPPPLFTDSRAHDVGTATEYRSLYASSGKDRNTESFYSPILVELWRTAPYLHDGSALTLRELLTTRNPADRHGRTSQLSPREIEELTQYLLSL